MQFPMKNVQLRRYDILIRYGRVFHRNFQKNRPSRLGRGVKAVSL